MTNAPLSLGSFRDDPKAFEKLYRELAPKLVSYLVANGSDYATAGDIAQETFQRLWKRREDLTDDAERQGKRLPSRFRSKALYENNG